jgi:hypothetical protein
MNINVIIGGGKSSLENLNPEVGQRYKESDNEFGLASIDHFALPTKNIVLMEHFIREVLGGKPYYYAGFDRPTRIWDAPSTSSSASGMC